MDTDLILNFIKRHQKKSRSKFFYWKFREYCKKNPEKLRNKKIVRAKAEVINVFLK